MPCGGMVSVLLASPTIVGVVGDHVGPAVEGFQAQRGVFGSVGVPGQAGAGGATIGKVAKPSTVWPPCRGCQAPGTHLTIMKSDLLSCRSWVTASICQLQAGRIAVVTAGVPSAADVCACGSHAARNSRALDPTGACICHLGGATHASVLGVPQLSR